MDDALNGALASAIRGRRDDMLERIRELVLVNSHTKNRAGGQRVAELLAREAHALGLHTRRVVSELYADHLIVETELGATSSEGAVALVGHFDTVFPEGSFEGYRCEEGIARGPGVLDMKGGLVVALESLRALKQAGALDRLALRFVIVSEEEIGSPEGRPILQRELAGASCALVFEAGRAEDKVITSRKGTGSAKAIAKGKAAHAANGHKEGKNAIWAMAKFVDGAQSLTDYARGVTVNVGLIKGGEAKNTVPDHCEVELDFRFQTIADADATFARMKEIALAASSAVEGTSIEISGGPARYPLERTPENVALFEAYAACAKAAGLGYAEAGLIAGGSDASSTSAIGIPSIDGLGPRGSGFHTKEELIETASLEPKALALATFLATKLR